MAGGVRGDFDRFGLWAWVFTRSAYDVGFVWFEVVGGVRGVGASMGQSIFAMSVGQEGWIQEGGIWFAGVE